jgi:hypothetical protein
MNCSIEMRRQMFNFAKVATKRGTSIETENSSIIGQHPMCIQKQFTLLESQLFENITETDNDEFPFLQCSIDESTNTSISSTIVPMSACCCQCNNMQTGSTVYSRNIEKMNKNKLEKVMLQQCKTRLRDLKPKLTSSTLSLVKPFNQQQQQQNIMITHKANELNNENGITFNVDFASTPKRLAQRSSTPTKPVFAQRKSILTSTLNDNSININFDVEKNNKQSSNSLQLSAIEKGIGKS